jgi:hypothetical protein
VGRGGAAPAAAPTTNHDDPRLHLLLDDEEIEKTEHLERVLNRPRKHSGPVLVADRPWEGERAQAWGSVIAEPDGRLRMWYFAFNTERRSDELDRGGYAYAESRDGIHWEKPPLGVVEFRGSKANNLFYTCAPDGKNLVEEEVARRRTGLPAIDENGNTIGVLSNLDGLTVVRDDDDPDPRARYKLIANMQDHRMWAPFYKDHYPDVTEAEVRQARSVFGQYMDTSPDGIHWTRRPRRILKAVGDYMMVTRDHRNRRWWLNERASGKRGRNAALRTSTDLRQWSPVELVFDNEAESENGKIWEWHGGITPFNYGGMNLGLLERWATGGFGSYCELVCQREGQPWRRVAPGRPFLDVGSEGDFDRTLAYPAHNAPIRLGDRLYIFYTGAGVRRNPRQGVPMAIGVATIGADRFVALANWRPHAAGRLVTKPVTVTGARLELNVELYETNPPRVALTAEDGSALSGYSMEECQVEAQYDRIYTPVRWKAKASVAELVGRKVRLEVAIHGAALYAYRFTGPKA